MKKQLLQNIKCKEHLIFISKKFYVHQMSKDLENVERDEPSTEAGTGLGENPGNLFIEIERKKV